MQQSGSWASQPVGQLAVWPPKQRGMPFESNLQTSCLPKQQFCDALTLSHSGSSFGQAPPQMFPGGLHAPPLSQSSFTGSHVTHFDSWTRWFTLQQEAVESQ
jgi:hypothetical protein